MRSQSSAELRGRVKSTVEPYIVAPEKLVILLEKSGSEIEWYDGILENESRNIVTVGSNIRTFCLQRGNRGFGFTTEIRRVSGNTGSTCTCIIIIKLLLYYYCHYEFQLCFDVVISL